MRIMKILILVILICILFGCNEEKQLGTKQIEAKQRNAAAFKACLDSGGVPMQSWFNESILGDCKYSPAKIDKD